MELVDICFNFTSSAFRDDESGVIRRANKAGVKQFIITGSNAQDSEHALQLSQQYEGMFSTAGVHPHLAKDWTDETLQQLHNLATHTQVVAIGEAGLDYNRNYSNHSAQMHALEAQLELAAKLGMPVFLHQRDAHNDFANVLKKYREKLVNVVVHCFTDSEEALRCYIDLDCHIGITGWICDERRGQHLHKSIPLIPSDRLMIETDSPYLLPRDLPQDSHFSKPKGRRNEPAYLAHILNTVAKIRSSSAEIIAQETTQTAREFFSIP